MRRLAAFPSVAAAALAVACAPAFAHDGAGAHGLAAGLAHPVGGLDHLAATVGLGLVAGLAGGARGTPPGRAALAAVLGALAGAAWALAGAGSARDAMEAGASLGLLALALALLAGARLGPRGLALGALAIAVPHGWLHASEATGTAFLAGLATTSVLLFAVGAGAGAALAAAPAPRRVAARRLLAATMLGAFAWTATAVVR